MQRPQEPYKDESIVHIGRLWLACADTHYPNIWRVERTSSSWRACITVGFYLRMVDPTRRLDLVCEFWDTWNEEVLPRAYDFITWFARHYPEEFATCRERLEPWNRLTGSQNVV